MRTNEPLIAGTALAAALESLPGWSASDGWLHRTYRTDGWRTTMLVVNAIAYVAEAGNHHPDLGVHWGRVNVALQTHSAGGITQKDLELAARLEAALTWQPSDGFPGLEGQSTPIVTD